MESYFCFPGGKPPFDILDISATERHCSRLIETLNTATAGLAAGELITTNLSRRPSEFGEKLDDLLSKISKIEKPSAADQQTLDTHWSPITVDPAVFDSLPFERWLKDTFTIRKCEFSKLAFRLTVVKSLEEHITALRNLSDLKRDLDATDCSAQTLRSSPFFHALESRCQFLRSAANDLKIPHPLVSQIALVVESVKQACDFLQKRLGEVVPEFKDEIARMEKQLATREEYVSNLKSRLSPMIQDDDISPTPTEIPENLASLQHSDAADVDTALVAQVNGLYRKALKVSNQVQSDLHGLVDKTRRILDLAVSLSKAEEQADRRKHESDIAREYERVLEGLVNDLKIEENDQMAPLLEKLVSTLHMGFLTAKHKEEQVMVQTEARSLDEEIEAEKSAIGEIDAELESLELEIYRLKDTTKRDKGSGNRKGTVAMIREKNLDLVRLVMCPVCGGKEREVIIHGCGHAMCKDCQKSKNRACAVCGKAYVATDVRPFVFNK
jgi:hypothetical protein